MIKSKSLDQGLNRDNADFNNSSPRSKRKNSADCIAQNFEEKSSLIENDDCKKHKITEQDQELKLINVENERIIEEINKRYPFLRNENLDTVNYRKNPELTSENDAKLDKNVKFYLNQIKSKPDGDQIDKIHKNWWGNYEKLEYHHGFIQWLFPIRTQGMNDESQPLQLHELESMRKNQEIRNRLSKSFELMLDFYGMKIKNRETGEIERTENYKKRYVNLISRRHNYLRITRILKCLGDMNLENLQIGWITFLIDEIFLTGELSNLDTSMANFWVHTIKSDNIRHGLIEKIEQLLLKNNKK